MAKSLAVYYYRCSKLVLNFEPGNDDCDASTVYNNELTDVLLNLQPVNKAISAMY